MCQVVERQIFPNDSRYTFAEMTSIDWNVTGFTRVSCTRFHMISQSPKHDYEPMEYSFSEEVPESRIHITECLWNKCFFDDFSVILRNVLQNEQ